MPLLSLQRLDEQGLRLALTAINSFAEKLAYAPYHPAPWAVSGGATLLRPVVGGVKYDISAAKLPVGGGNPTITGSFPLPPDWVTGVLGMAILYSGDVAADKDIGFGYALSPVVLGDAVPEAAVTTFVAAGPAAIMAELRVAVPTLFAVEGNAQSIAWKLRREIGDAYETTSGGNVFVFGVYPLWSARKQ